MNSIHSLSKEKKLKNENNFIKKVSLKIINIIYKSTCSTWYERSIEGDLENFEPTIDIDIQREFLMDDKSELINWLEMNKEKFPWIYFPKEIECANKNSHIFYILKYKNQIIGYSKVGVRNTYVHDFNRNIHLNKNTAMIYDIFIDPNQKGKGLAKYALKDIFRYLKSKGYKKVIAHIEKWNYPSINTFTKSGFRPKKIICLIRILGIPIYIKNGYIPFRNIEKVINN
ncbi:RimJ/RimL family protein N-acetyltransferase [Acetoanaerobium pronyense]|uniref:RimJ/RimL family protein N-acetyltransferase n=1 Tax=Acetoanaerobium pronyense TaxID=1482736 RepID=A0ABS4KHD9_9FIRM|nr:GNAT family N-acetyltransferase [Acetoanaerobium pronyense]MBP2027197.1 RimJ/RimL family protein N-acetyltransferase [Acetoanaerobium pronyense]